MKNKILGWIGAVWGGLMLLTGLTKLLSEGMGGGAYGAGPLPGVFFAGLVCFAGIYTLLKKPKARIQPASAIPASLRKNIKIAVLYNALLVAFQLVFELMSHDRTGMGMLLLPVALTALTLLHCGMIFCHSFRRQKESFKSRLSVMFAVVGVNAAAFFVDVALVVEMLRLLLELGFIHT